VSKKGLLAHARIFNIDMRSDAQHSSSSNDASAEPSALIDNAFPSQKNTNHSRQLASENVDKVFPFNETGNQLGQDLFEPGIEQYCNSTLKVYLEMRGVHVPPAWGRDEILAEVRRHQPKVDAGSAPAMPSEDTSISPGAADATFENWPVDHLESYLALVQEYPAAKSFLGADDDIQLHEILLEHEPNQYRFSKALQGAARDLARELVLARQDANDYDRQNAIVGICRRGLLDGIFLPGKSRMLNASHKPS
jgi:hypothetical protein